MGHFSRKAHSLQGINLHPSLSPQLYLQDIHLADQDIRFKLAGVGELYGHRSL